MTVSSPLSPGVQRGSSSTVQIASDSRGFFGHCVAALPRRADAADKIERGVELVRRRDGDLALAQSEEVVTGTRLGALIGLRSIIARRWHADAKIASAPRERCCLPSPLRGGSTRNARRGGGGEDLFSSLMTSPRDPHPYPSPQGGGKKKTSRERDRLTVTRHPEAAATRPSKDAAGAFEPSSFAAQGFAARTFRMTKFLVSVVVDMRHLFQLPSISYLAQSDAAWEAFPDRAGECGARARTCNPLPGGFGHQPLGTRTGARGAIAGLGQAGARLKARQYAVRPRSQKSLASVGVSPRDDIFLGVARDRKEHRQPCPSRFVVAARFRASAG